MQVRLKFIDDRLCIPLIVIYPEFSQFDVVEHTYEDDSVTTHVQNVIREGVPWDIEHHYKINSIETYV